MSRHIENAFIKGYRGINEIKIEGFKHVNLFVGNNNSGKTSVLEALYIFQSEYKWYAIEDVLASRGEKLSQDDSFKNIYMDRRFDISSLFYGYALAKGSMITINCLVDGELEQLHIAVNYPPPLFMDPNVIANPERHPIRLQGLELHIHDKLGTVSVVKGLDRQGIIKPQLLATPIEELGASQDLASYHSFFIPKDGFDFGLMVKLWNKLVLTDLEIVVIEALKCIDNRVERITLSLSLDGRNSAKSCFRVKLRGLSRPVPIGSLGDGMWKLLCIAIAMTNCVGGAALFDEIDNGLHYSVQDALWKLIYDFALTHNMQVFASTHSNDCIQSFSRAASAYDVEAAMHRIDRSNDAVFTMDGEEIQLGVENNIEVR